MLSVGQHVRIADTGHIGVITKIESEHVVEVFVKHPKTYSIFVRTHLVKPVSFEQEIEEIFGQPDGDGWAGEWDTKIPQKDYWNMNEEDFIIIDPFENPNPSEVTYLTYEMKEDLKQMYIDMALATKDFEWLAELTK